MARKSAKQLKQTPPKDVKPHPKKKPEGNAGTIGKLMVLLAVVGAAVAGGAYFHKKQNEKPLGYEYFKKRGYDKINTLESEPKEPPKSPLEEDLEDAKAKAQRNIFLQD